MKSFKEYSKNAPRQPRNPAETPADDASAAETLTKKIAAAYSGKSNADMWRSILAEAEKSRRAGTLSDEEIDRFYQSFAPMLDGAQKRRLRAVVERLKQI